MPAEQLVERIGVPVEEAMEALSVLELRGKVRRESGIYRAVADGLFC
jgi:predicted Rossmann fold nucleotide-binding protein DprA/Smf involved in DNA uptake